MSMVEVTRVQILKAQAERMVISATQSVLAGYDSALKNEYGLFARNPNYGDWFFVMPNESPIKQKPMAIDFAYYLRENASQKVEDIDMSLVDKLVYGRDSRQYFAMAPLEMTSSYVEGSNELHTLEGVDYIKQDMVDYMEMRLPLIALKPILESFGAAEKLGKTTEFIEGKNKQIKKAASIESLYLQLYRTIDGAIIDEVTGAITIEDSNYVNRLIVSEGHVDQRAHMPSNVPLNNAHKIVENIVNYQNDFDHIQKLIPQLTTSYEEYKTANKTFEVVGKAIDEVERKIKSKSNKLKLIQLECAKLKGIYDIILDENKIKVLSLEAEAYEVEKKINQLKDELSDLEQEQLESENAIKATKEALHGHFTKIDLYQSNIDEDRDRISQLVQGTDSYLSTTNRTLETVALIMQQGIELSEFIDVFLTRSEGDKDQYIASTYEQSTLELEAIQSSYSGDGKDFKIKNNLERIQSVLTTNKTLLEKEEATIEVLTKGYKSYLVGLFNAEGIEKTVLWDMLKVSEGPSDFYESHLMRDPWMNDTSPDALKSSLLDLKHSLEGYSGGDLLDYSGYTLMIDTEIQGEEASEQGNHLLQVMKDLVNQYSLSNTLFGEIPDKFVLPEGLFSEKFIFASSEDLVEPRTDYDIESYKTGDVGNDDDVFMEAGKETENITLLENVKEQLLINEYAVGMFSSYPDSNRLEVATLSGYDKENHAMATELEYIYTGIKDSDQALRNVAIKIFGLRVAFNSVHLATDSAKRTIITNVATMIAGWWTAGIGTLILSLIIGLLWATIESLVDIKLLLQGTSVPLLKTNMTWYTGIEGMADLLIDTSIDVLTEVADDSIDIAVSKGKELLGNYESQVTDEVSMVIDREVSAVFRDAKQMAGLVVEDFEKAFYEVIDQVLLSYQNGSAMVTAEDYFEAGSPEHELLEEVIDTMKDALDREVEHSYEQLLTLKVTVMANFQGKFEDLQKVITERVTNEITGVVNEGFVTLSSEIDTMAVEGKEVSADFIRSKMSGYKDQLAEKTKSVSSGVKPAKSKVDVSMMIPSVPYEMYLRLFMMMKHEDLDNRVLRMVDLIDVNLAVSKSDSKETVVREEQLVMSSYVYGITAGATFRLENMWEDLPLAAFKSQISDNYYTLQVKAVNRYE